MNEPSDAELMALVQREDRDAFAAIVERHKHALVGYLSRLTGSRDRADYTQGAARRARARSVRSPMRVVFAGTPEPAVPTVLDRESGAAPPS